MKNFPKLRKIHILNHFKLFCLHKNSHRHKWDLEKFINLQLRTRGRSFHDYYSYLNKLNCLPETKKIKKD